MRSILRKILLPFCLVTGVAYAQAPAGVIAPKDLVTFPSPQASEIARYGQVPVDVYNGLMNVSIPLYQFPVKGIPVNVGMSYHAGGVKPNVKGGWLGIGWSLNATGTITRIQNGMPDEKVDASVSAPYDKQGYYWNQSTLNRTDWETPVALKNLLDRVVCQGAYGSGACGGISVPLTDWAPDEFLFNFCGYSGSFWIDHNGHWVARENNGEKLVIELTGTVGAYSYGYPAFPGSIQASTQKQIPNMMKGFTVTDGMGNKFYFGNDPNNIELNRNANGNNYLNATPSTWYLKQITTYLNETVNFTYSRKYPTLSLASSIKSYEAKVGTRNYDAVTNLQDLGGVVQDPVYLQTITFNDYVLSVDYSESPLAQYPSDALTAGIDKTKYNVDGPIYYKTDDGGIAPPKEFKIDKVTITNDNYIKRFTFSYFDQTVANRLFLKTVTEGPPQSSQLIHQFEYNGMLFDQSRDVLNKFYEGYLTTKTDHWGFYNAKIPIETSLLPVDGNGYYQLESTAYPSQSLIDAYNTNRNPNATAMLIGSLKKITYPTGGFTEFVYEPHSYSKKIDLAGVGTVSAGGDIMAGGLRISQVKSFTDAGATALVKQYYYKNADGSSSGVLNSRGVSYVDERTGTTSQTNEAFSYKFFYDASQYPLLNTSGNHVTYSRIEEVLENGSKTTYTFSNHDDARFTDIAPFYGLFSTSNAQLYVKNSSRDYARGRELDQQNFLVAATSSMKTINTDFENDASILASKTGIRTYSLRPKDIVMSSFHKTGQLGLQGIFSEGYIYDPNITSNLYYVHPYRVVQKQVTENANGISYNQTQTFTYNSSNNKVFQETLTNPSTGGSKSTKYYYPSDFTGTAVYDNMVLPAKNMVNNVIKIENYIGTQLLTTNKTNYSTVNGNTLTLPSSGESSKASFSAETDMTYNVYDSRGNILEATPKNGVKMSYIWGYSGNFPIAKAINASQYNIAATSFETNSTGNLSYDNAAVTITAPNIVTGSKAYNLAFSSPISTNSGLSKSITYRVSYWSRNGAYQVLQGNSGVAGITVNGWTYYEHTVVNPMDPITINGTGLIDEVRVYPAVAQMITYTYQPFGGIASECDVNNHIIYYAYDVFNRLILVRDQDRNIIKRYCYNYAGKPENDCVLGVAPVWQSTGQTRCQPCPANTNYINNIQEHEEKDLNPNSPTYNTFQWVSDGTNSACVVQPDWQNTTAALRCQQNSQSQNTTHQEQQQLDHNPCSSTYNQTRWVDIGVNATACPLPTCPDCTAINQKCIQDPSGYVYCATGVRVCTASAYIGGGKFRNTVHYEFPDGSWSGTSKELSTCNCDNSICY